MAEDCFTATAMTGAPSITHWFDRRCRDAQRRKAITHQDRTLSYGDLKAKVDGLAGYWSQLGIGKGDRVGILAFNCPEVLIALLAAARIGAIFVPVNFRLAPAELTYVINDAGISQLLVGSEFEDVIEALRDSLCTSGYIALAASDGAMADRNGWTTFDKVVLARPQPPFPVLPDDPVTILYTSGTTGKPKGAIITHRNVWANNLNWILGYGCSLDEVMLTTAPMFHAGGLFAEVLTVLMMGGHLVIQSQFDPGAFLAAIEAHRVTITFGVPTMLLALTRHPDFAGVDLSSLRLYIVGGAPSPVPLLRICADRNIPVTHTYGMTEATSLHSFLGPVQALEKIGSTGRPVLLGETRLVDAEGGVVTAEGEKAEIALRGPHMFAGYWQLPEATAAAFLPGRWFRTGDVGYLQDGFLYVCDRVKDMIISGGENVYPAEVESVLAGHPAIAEAAVVGAPDPVWGESVVAAVVLRPGASLGLEELRAYCRQMLAGYKLPKHLHLLEAMPLSGSGKIQKQSLREQVRHAFKETRNDQ
ncbi:class I adenylate-forming enzyme family protein [Paracoccus sp. FO-3]|uniref:class I adenylate-forming enzyme family protein n=1 Tax=Paracoccus sp. FO-3 TaxID=1335059 RepID=UPI00112A94D4|nr:long-chain fatty acid--CoA ligase [Paracoccus sp. FO-3]